MSIHSKNRYIVPAILLTNLSAQTGSSGVAPRMLELLAALVLSKERERMIKTVESIFISLDFYCQHKIGNCVKDGKVEHKKIPF